jgi:hypothetical protein
MAAASICKSVLTSGTLDDLARNPKRKPIAKEKIVKETEGSLVKPKPSVNNAPQSTTGEDVPYEQLVTFAPVSMCFPVAGVIEVVVHAGPIDQVENIDVIVASENTHFDLARPFKPSTSGRLRRAAAVKNQRGKIVKDVVFDELEGWRAEENFGNEIVQDGIVVSTSSGEMKKQGIIRIYHAAVVKPIQGVHGYTTDTEIIELASEETIALLVREQKRGIIPKPCTICLPLFGAGRGKLNPEQSFRAMMRGLSSGIEKYQPALLSLHFCTMMKRETSILLKIIKMPWL